MKKPFAKWIEVLPDYLSTRDGREVGLIIHHCNSRGRRVPQHYPIVGESRADVEAKIVDFISREDVRIYGEFTLILRSNTQH